MKSCIFFGLLVFLLLAQAVAASDVVSCTVSPQEVNLSVSAQVAVTVYLNNTQNATATDAVEIAFPTSTLSCIGNCVKQVSIAPYSTDNVSFTLQALTTTAAEQSITVNRPTLYTCPPVLRITGADTAAPVVGPVSPASVTTGRSTTFTATVSDDVGVASCNLFFDGVSYPAAVANNVASYALYPAEGSHSAYFKCQDAAGNTGTGPATAVTASKPQLSASVSLPKTTYYPAESFNPRVTVTDPEGKIVVDATVSGNLTYGTKFEYVGFFYSVLCDCYKAYHWLGEGSLPNDYMLTVTASHPSYKSATATAAFTLIKPTLALTMSTDKAEYNPGDSIKVTTEVKDILGNAITDASVKGEIRDASTGALITTIWPWVKEKIYYYDYYMGAESVGKSYNISVTASWKEQTASASKTVTFTERGLNADIVLEKDVLMPGDTLQGKLKVFDKGGNIITDAKVNIEIKDTNGKFPAQPVRWLSATYKDGFYEIEKWKVDDWMLAGTYTLSVRIERFQEFVTLEKTIEITKEKLNAQIILDQSSYAPGDRIYIKVLVTYSNGSVVGNANIGGEIFPLTQEVTNETTGVTGAAIIVAAGAVLHTTGELPRACRVYVSPLAPIYYKGRYIPRYYIDDNWIPNQCPTGTYVLRLRVNAPGYAETEFTKEFDVTLHKLLLEAGFKIYSRVDAVDLDVYAEVKDEQGKTVPYVNMKGYLHPAAGNATEQCLKAVYFGYEEFTNRYTSRMSVGKSECPAGDYLLEMTASQPSYETAAVTQTVKIEYSEGYKYGVVVPSSVVTPVCKEVECGPNCTNRICEAATAPQQCYEEVTDKNCIQTCIDKVTAAEKTGSEFDVSGCMDNCTKKVACRGSAVTTTESQDMLAKLDQIHTEVTKTGKEVAVIEQLLRAIIGFFNSLVAAFGKGQVAPINTTTT